ncbi:hypothetical protein SNF32_16090 [Enterococcus mundtii]|nr:hypothetical protein [Enterococcus mundtii]
MGEEVTIRQLLYDFYFSLPVYPEVAIEKIKQLCKIQTRVQKGAWQIDEKRMNQWIVIAQLRITQRCELKKMRKLLSKNACTSIQLSSHNFVTKSRKSSTISFILKGGTVS